MPSAGRHYSAASGFRFLETFDRFFGIDFGFHTLDWLDDSTTSKRTRLEGRQFAIAGEAQAKEVPAAGSLIVGRIGRMSAAERSKHLERRDVEKKGVEHKAQHH